MLYKRGRLSPVSKYPTPLTADELRLLESKDGVGLSTTDVRRLLANHARLRGLVLEAARVLASNAPVSGEQARELHRELKDEAER